MCNDYFSISDQEKFAWAIAKPPEPGKALTKAYARYKTIEVTDGPTDYDLYDQIDYMPYGVKAGVSYELDETGQPKKYWYSVRVCGGIVGMRQHISNPVEKEIFRGVGESVVYYSMYSYEKDLDKTFNLNT